MTTGALKKLGLVRVTAGEERGAASVCTIR